jgi:hypothetical protein
VAGLFVYDQQAKEEQRLFQKNDFLAYGFDYSAERDEFVIATADDDGSYNLDLFNGEGRYLRTLTGGDSVDIMPSFHGNSVVFQSASIARGNAGEILAVAPMDILSVDLDDGAVQTLRSASDADHLRPTVDGEGRLLFIRRPYEMYPGRGGLSDFLGCLMVPVHFLRTVYDFMRAVAGRMNQRPDAIAQSDGTKVVSVLGHQVDFGKLKRRKDQSYSIVPSSWALWRGPLSGGTDEKLASEVLAFHLDVDRLLLSDGSTLRQHSDGTRLLRQDLISDLG